MTLTTQINLDLENLPAGLQVGDLLEACTCDGAGKVNTIKLGYGDVLRISRSLRRQMLDFNFRVIDTPHVKGKKNRADLMISVDALQSAFASSPFIGRYVFATSDSDFSIVMDRLRTLGKQVWLASPRTDASICTLRNSCDRVLVLEEFMELADAHAESDGPPAGNADNAIRVLRETLRNVPSSRLPLDLPTLGNQMRIVDRDFKYAGTGFRCLSDLVRYCEGQGVLQIGQDASGQLQIERICVEHGGSATVRFPRFA